MKALISALVFLNFATVPVFALDAIPGSITYGAGPMSRLQNAPVGSPVSHNFHNGGSEYNETYVIQPDRSLKLTHRVRVQD